MSNIEALLAQHETARLNAINLIVSENRMSPRARAPLSSDIHSRVDDEGPPDPAALRGWRRPERGRPLECP